MRFANDKNLQHNENDFEQLEQNSGIWGYEELPFLTSKAENKIYNYATDSSLNVAKMNSILDGDVVDAINEVKNLIASTIYN